MARRSTGRSARPLRALFPTTQPPDNEAICGSVSHGRFLVLGSEKPRAPPIATSEASCSIQPSYPAVCLACFWSDSSLPRLAVAAAKIRVGNRVPAPARRVVPARRPRVATLRRPTPARRLTLARRPWAAPAPPPARQRARLVAKPAIARAASARATCACRACRFRIRTVRPERIARVASASPARVSSRPALQERSIWPTACQARSAACASR